MAPRLIQKAQPESAYTTIFRVLLEHIHSTLTLTGRYTWKSAESTPQEDSLATCMLSGSTRKMPTQSCYGYLGHEVRTGVYGSLSKS